MKVVVPIKQVLDYNLRPRVKVDGSGVDLTNMKMSMNPFDERAVEEAVRLKEAGKVSEVVVVSIGPTRAQEALRTALAMGADRAMLIQVDGVVEPLAVAKLLRAVDEEERPGLRHLTRRRQPRHRRRQPRPGSCWCLVRAKA